MLILDIIFLIRNEVNFDYNNKNIHKKINYRPFLSRYLPHGTCQFVPFANRRMFQ